LRRQLLPRLTLLLGLFCAYSQVSSTLHWLLVEHARCADHGEWVHVAEEHHAHEAEDATPASPSVAAAERDAHGHDHCQFLVDARSLTPVSRPEALIPSPTESLGPDLIGPSDCSLPVALYRLAPKTSPPAARS
jgi:hypothetical protein